MTACDSCPLIVCIDVLCALAAFVPYAVLRLINGQPLNKRGFFCNDDSLNLPYKQDTVTSKGLLIFCVVAPLLLVVFTELLHLLTAKMTSVERSKYKLRKRLVDCAFPLMYAAIGLHMFGSGVTLSTTYIAKYLIGSLRPNFFQTCNPNVTLDQCVDGVGKAVYIQEYECTGTDRHAMYQSRLSFPSGHASSATFTMFYLACYIQLRWNWQGSGLLRPLFQAVLITLAVLVALSRLCDNKHHWWDVLAGVLQGAFIAIWMGVRLFIFIKNSILEPSYNRNDYLDESQMHLRRY